MSTKKAIQWVIENTVSEPGVGLFAPISDKDRRIYPEVTGYLIPTLLNYKYTSLAKSYADSLLKIQHPDGYWTGPDGKTPFAFDTAQCVRGLMALPYNTDLFDPIDRACRWIIDNSTKEGRLPIPEGNAWNMGERGTIPEAVHLYCLQYMWKFGYTAFAQKSMDYYLNNCNLTDFNQPNMLSHFFCYIQEALVDSGYKELAWKGMYGLHSFGTVPAFHDVQWICSPGQAQAALVWYKLEAKYFGDLSLNYLRSHQEESGGFKGSFGPGANYFPDQEISWAVKFFLDAEYEGSKLK